MDCEICGQKATVHFTQLVDGTMKKKSFCETCAAGEGILDLGGFGLMDAVMANPVSAIPEAAGGTCPVCGFTRQKFQQVGRLGCSHCYQVFARELEGRLPTMHRGVLHKGKIPSGALAGKAINARLARLKGELSAMIAEERFEKAAQIRDEILNLEKEAEVLA